MGKNKKGFTLIELSFAILFISVLLLTIILIASEIISLFRKGIALKSVNAVGQELIDNFTNSIAQSNPGNTASLCQLGQFEDGKDLCLTDNGMKFIYQQFVTQINTKNGDKDYPYGGMICLGNYSYLYQTGFVKNTDYYTPKGISGIEFQYSDNSGHTRNTHDFTLLKFTDPGKKLCLNNLDNEYSYKNETTTVNGKTFLLVKYPSGNNLFSDEPLELLPKSDNELAIYNFVVNPPAKDPATGHSIVSASFILATVLGEVDILTNSNYCTEPSTYSMNYSYCAINKFNFTIRANGGKS